MNRIDKEKFKPPPFNMAKAYEVFGIESVKEDGELAEGIANRFNSLHLPHDLIPMTTIALQQGQMFLVWDSNKNCMGFALHKL
jgi:hypothetical protein